MEKQKLDMDRRVRFMIVLMLGTILATVTMGVAAIARLNSFHAESLIDEFIYYTPSLLLCAFIPTRLQWAYDL